jgi:hypothetical protein
MYMMAFIACLLLLGCASAAMPVLVGGVDLGAWDAVLSKNVRKAAQFGIPLHTVNYPQIAEDANFASFILSLASADLSSLTRNESFALGINAYNAFAVKTLIDNACKYEDQEARKGACLGATYGLPDIKIGNETGFSKKMHNLGGTKFSLNDIEGMMRPKPLAPLFVPPIDIKEDLRTHGCLVCDGTSCPNLALTAFTPKDIESQMDAAVTDWMGNPYKGLHINTATNTVHFSKIISWFKDEFDAQGGVEKAYLKYMPAAAQAYFNAGTKHTIDFFGYVWDANGPVPCACIPDLAVSSTEIEANCHVK